MIIMSVFHCFSAKNLMPRCETELFLVEKVGMLNNLLPFICPHDLFKDDSLGYMPRVQQVCRTQGAVEAQSPNNFENKVLHHKH